MNLPNSSLDDTASGQWFSNFKACRNYLFNSLLKLFPRLHAQKFSSRSGCGSWICISIKLKGDVNTPGLRYTLRISQRNKYHLCLLSAVMKQYFLLVSLKLQKASSSRMISLVKNLCSSKQLVFTQLVVFSEQKSPFPSYDLFHP